MHGSDTSLLHCQDGDRRTVPWYREDGSRNIVRHPLNERRAGGAVKAYASRIYAAGIVDGVRGEPWLVFDSSKNQFLALTFGTLSLGSCVAVGGRITSHVSLRPLVLLVFVCACRLFFFTSS